MRLLLGGSERHAAPDVHDANERSTAGKADHRGTDEVISRRERFDQRCVVEFPGQKKDQAIQAASAGRTRWHLANGAGRHRSRAGISKMYRMLSLSGCLSCAA